MLMHNEPLSAVSLTSFCDPSAEYAIYFVVTDASNGERARPGVFPKTHTFFLSQTQDKKKHGGMVLEVRATG